MKEILGHTSTYIETRRDQTINGKRKKKKENGYRRKDSEKEIGKHVKPNYTY